MLNWQIGKKYRRRNGIISIMTRDFASSVLPKRAIDFDDGNPVWAENAQRSNAYIGEYDIIEEVKENEMKIEVGKYYKTRDGRKAFVGGEINNLRYYGHIEERIREWDNHGVLYGPGNELDLIEEWKEPKSGVTYMNVYQYHDGEVWEGTVTSKKENVERWAKEEEKLKNIRIACVRIEWKEGQFDD